MEKIKNILCKTRQTIYKTHFGTFHLVRDHAAKSFHQASKHHSVVLTDKAVQIVARLLVSQFLAHALNGNHLQKQLVDDLVVFSLDGQVQFSVLVFVLVGVNDGEVGSLHDVLKFGLLLREVLFGKITILDMHCLFLLLCGLVVHAQIDILTEAFPVVHFIDEGQSVLQVIIESVVDLSLKGGVVLLVVLVEIERLKMLVHKLLLVTLQSLDL